jgi:hypothetical protein
MDEDNHVGGSPLPLSDGATTTACTEAAQEVAHIQVPVTGEQPISPPANTRTKRMRNRISHSKMSDEEFRQKLDEFRQLQTDEVDSVLRRGRVLAEVKERTEPGRWGKFCHQADITRKTADSYIYVARSPYADKLRGLGIARALVIAQHPQKANDLLRRPPVEEIAKMKSRDLQQKLRGGKAPQPRTDPKWALGVLRLRPDALKDKRTMLDQARQSHMTDRQLSTDPELLAILDEAYEVIVELAKPKGTPKPKAATAPAAATKKRSASRKRQTAAASTSTLVMPSGPMMPVAAKSEVAA